MSNPEGGEKPKVVPRRSYGLLIDDKESRLPTSLPIVGLGCSSFSTTMTTFWSDEEVQENNAANWRCENIDKHHPRVQEWIQVMHHAVECGINLFDTAPWYNTSEAVVGFFIEDTKVEREKLIINTKVGRFYEPPEKQFDFSYDSIISSVQRSLARLKCNYIDVLQLHDPEFSPSFDIILKETIPALLECRKRGYCKALGLTGYPLKTQHLILQKSLELAAESGKIWDQSLTYCHFNLADRSLFNQTITGTIAVSFADFCKHNKIGLMAAAPLAMGLLTKNTLPEWHAAQPALREACSRAASICESQDVDIVKQAILFALSNPNIPCTILGMKNVSEVKLSHSLALRFSGLKEEGMTQEDILKAILTDNEHKVWLQLNDPKDGPFASIWSEGTFSWDGVAEAKKFWKQVDGVEQTNWQEA